MRYIILAWQFVKSHQRPFAVAATIVVAVYAIERSVAASAADRRAARDQARKNVALAERREVLAAAAKLREVGESLRKIAGVDRAVDVDFAVAQPNRVKVTVDIDPSLVQSAAVTYDKGETWRSLYQAGMERPAASVAIRPSLQVKDEQAFASPESGKRTVTALVRVEYVGEVTRAFPESRKPAWTDFAGLCELTPGGIIRLAGEDPSKAKPEMVIGTVPTPVRGWELVHSLDATADLANDRDGALAATFKLDKVGEWVNLSHSVPGARPAKPTVSLEEMTGISVTLLWTGKGSVTVETKLVDDLGKIVGALKFTEPSDKPQTIHVPIRAFKGYWDVKTFDFGRVRRVDLAVSRKAKDQAAEGTIKIQRIELRGTAKLPPPFEVDRNKLTTLAELPLDPAGWQTFHNKPAEIKLTKQAGLLACQVGLPYDRERDKDLPYTDIVTKLQQQDFPNLQAIELELKWDGPAPITLEPKLTTSEYGDTYGIQRRIEPSREYQKVLLYPHDLKYYWSVGATRDATRMNLRELVQFALGIGRKAHDQADRGTLYVKAIRLLGPAEKPEAE